jgi:ribosome biogenesis protein BMS1
VGLGLTAAPAPGPHCALASVLQELDPLPDPCPLPDTIKRRGLNDRERLLYAPMADVGGLLYDKDAVYIDIPDWKVRRGERPAAASRGGGHGASGARSPACHTPACLGLLNPQVQYTGDGLQPADDGEAMVQQLQVRRGLEKHWAQRGQSACDST